jgi:hypothetical protein
MASLRIELVRRLEKLGVEDRALPGRDDGFSSLSFGGKDFAHFHNDNELDIRLTKGIISSEGLVHPIDSRVHPNRSKSSHWIEVRFSKAADIERLVHLVRLAIEHI